MKILLASGRLSFSNPTTYTLQLARGLTARGHQVQVTLHGGSLTGRLTDLGVEWYHVRHNFFSFRRMIQFIREFGPDVIHATGGRRSLTTADRIREPLGVPLFHTVHSWLPTDRASRYPDHVDAFVVVNQNLREQLVNSLQVPKGRVRVVPYGVDPGMVCDPRAPLDGRIPVVGTIGRLGRGRRHDEFLRAAVLVRERLDGDVHFVVAGEGPDEVRLRKLTKDLKLNESVTFVQPRTADEVFSVIDILVLVSDWGGVGLNLLEAMKNDCPVIATGGGEVFSLLDQEDTCEVVPKNDLEGLADRIVSLVQDPARQKELAIRAHDHVVAQYPLDAHLVALENLYAEAEVPARA